MPDTNDIDALLRYLDGGASPWWGDSVRALVAQRDAFAKRVEVGERQLRLANIDQFNTEADANDRDRELRERRDEATAWRPIETAPRGSGLDGPHRRDAVGYVDPPALLLASRDGVVEVGSYDWYYHPGYGNGGSLGQSPWRDHYEGREIPEVTHWMPLPQPPREKEGGGA